MKNAAIIVLIIILITFASLYIKTYNNFTKEREDNTLHTLFITTNKNSFPLNNYTSPSDPHILWRWDADIPVQINGLKKAEDALATITKNTGIKFEIVADDIPLSHGIVFSKNTSRCFDGMTPTCRDSMSPELRKGTTSGGKNMTAWPPSLGPTAGVISTLLYINIGNETFDADTLDEDIYIHEIAHALGMFDHFDQFGGPQVFGPLAWQVLKTLYANPPGTGIYQAKPHL